MRVNSRYYDVSWDDFKKACRKQAPEGYKFKKKWNKEYIQVCYGRKQKKEKAR